MYEIIDIPIEKINCIKNLWYKLNKMHYEDSIYFEDHFESFTFEDRIEKFKNTNRENLKITIIKEDNRFLGYCISDIEKDIGEIESIFIEEELRGRGLGKKIMLDHMNWLKESGCKRIRVSVSYGHEKAVQKIYQSMGLYERLIVFELKNELV
jgi:diamine N-acetyltransferase